MELEDEVFNCPAFTVVRRASRNENMGFKSKPHYFLRKRSGVSVLAYRDTKILLLESYRPISKGTGFELPGGAIDRNEKPTDAASREFHEETGLVLKEPSKLTQINPYPNISDETLFIFEGRASGNLGQDLPAESKSEGIRRACFFSMDETLNLVKSASLHFSADVHAIVFSVLQSKRSVF